MSPQATRRGEETLSFEGTRPPDVAGAGGSSGVSTALLAGAAAVVVAMLGAGWWVRRNRPHPGFG